MFETETELCGGNLEGPAEPGVVAQHTWWHSCLTSWCHWITSHLTDIWFYTAAAFAALQKERFSISYITKMYHFHAGGTNITFDIWVISLSLFILWVKWEDWYHSCVCLQNKKLKARHNHFNKTIKYNPSAITLKAHWITCNISFAYCSRVPKELWWFSSAVWDNTMDPETQSRHERLLWVINNMHKSVCCDLYVSIHAEREITQNKTYRHVCHKYKHVLASLPGSSLIRAKGLNEAFWDLASEGQVHC